MSKQEKVYDSDIIGKQMGKAVERTINPSWLNSWNDFVSLIPRDNMGELILNEYVTGRLYLCFWCRGEKATAVEFENPDGKYLVGNTKETDHRKIIKWNQRVAWARQKERDVTSCFYSETQWIIDSQKGIEKRQLKV